MARSLPAACPRRGGFFLQRGAAGWLSRVLFVPFLFMFTMVRAAASVTIQANPGGRRIRLPARGR